MTKEQRLDQFNAGMESLKKEYGIDLVAVLHGEDMKPGMAIMKALIQAVEIPNWQPPEKKEVN